MAVINHLCWTKVTPIAVKSIPPNATRPNGSSNKTQAISDVTGGTKKNNEAVAVAAPLAINQNIKNIAPIDNANTDQAQANQSDGTKLNDRLCSNHNAKGNKAIVDAAY